PRTSTLDWCEENYLTSPYVAEFWNTMTNTCYLGLAALGIYFIRKYQMETRFAVCYAGMLLVGIGSCLFHTTLHFEMQLMDELPMIYATCICLYALIEMDSTRKYNAKLIAGLLAYCVFVTFTYISSPNPVFHQVAYGLEMVVILLRIVQLLGRIPEGEYKRQLSRLARFSTCTFLSGFAMWNLDNAFCSALQELRHTVGMPWAVVLQFHGWWHALTAVGCYGFILLTQSMRLFYLRKHHKYEIKYLRNILPVLHHRLDEKDFL
ncbi:ceramidase, partial [Dimargaris cristalligena]